MTPVTRGGDGYPGLLERLPDPPGRLWVRGTIPDVPAVAVVGSRRCTRYGVDMAGRIAHAVVTAGWTVISGLARGIDAAAHRSALDGSGDTVAVLGCGVDRWYPASNRSLGERILSAGAVVSEYPPGTDPAPWRFPARNRIIAGLSGAVVVVEAAVRSGALITARHALEAGIDVFAVPGDVDRETSEGANRLIADGAHPVVSVADLVEGLERVLGPALARDERDLPLAGPMFVHEIAAALGVTIGEAARRVARWELAGVVTVTGGMVEPVG